MTRQRIVFMAPSVLRSGAAAIVGMPDAVDPVAAGLLRRLLAQAKALLVLLPEAGGDLAEDCTMLRRHGIADWLHPTWRTPLAGLDGAMPWLTAAGVENRDVEGGHIAMVTELDDAPPLDTIFVDQGAGLGLREYRLAMAALNGEDVDLGVYPVSPADFSRVLDAMGWNWLAACAWLHSPASGPTMSALLADPEQRPEALARLPHRAFRGEPD